MNVGAWLIWGFAATVVLTTLMAGSQAANLTRMNLPYLLGTMVTPSRDKAKVLGIVMHLVNGWVFSLVYVLAFHQLGVATWWWGATVGFVHGAFVIAVAFPALPGIHPRMASETRGPTVVRHLEPPGFLGRHYGMRTPVSVLLSHLVYGGILGAFYPLG
ncbi:hypothetical protein [Vulgatibacter sp.]|uniref:hypothetical protein n=1 Tax=Vulgatibacter sp. TaxID=1971226 RepID=UPI0035664A7D